MIDVLTPPFQYGLPKKEWLDLIYDEDDEEFIVAVSAIEMVRPGKRANLSVIYLKSGDSWVVKESYDRICKMLKGEL